jgi:hypothetical protein
VTLEKYKGLSCIAVQCTSPKGVRQVTYRYHYQAGNDASQQAARFKALHRQATYMLQGWKTRSRLEQT